MPVEVQQFTLAEVGKRNGKEDNSMWIVIKDNVYDVTKYIKQHPGGYDLIEEVVGTDATQQFNEVGHSMDAYIILERLKIGEIVQSERKNKQNQTSEEKPKKCCICLGICTCCFDCLTAFLNIF